MGTEFTLSLTRWHKVAERLAAFYRETMQDVLRTIGQTTASKYYGDEQALRLTDEADRAWQGMHRAFAAQDMVATIRQALGSANENHSITTELAQVAKLSQRLKSVEELVESQQGHEMLSIEELQDSARTEAAVQVSYGSREYYRVRLMSRERQQALRDQAEEVRGQIFALTDRVNDLNRARITLDVPEELRVLAGL